MIGNDSGKRVPIMKQQETMEQDQDRAGRDQEAAAPLPPARIRVAVAAHKPYPMPQDELYLPMQVGKALHPDLSLADPVSGRPFTPDDSGDNISSQNAYYSELTALYWMWKNDPSAYKGLAHYRRHFASGTRRQGVQQGLKRQIVAYEEVARLLGTTDIILPRKRNYYIETIRSHYSHTMHDGARQLDVTRQVLQELAPQYLPAFDWVMAGRSAHIFNMFIMKADKFDSYCAFLFPVLQELAGRIDPAQYDGFDSRFLGRISERLLDVWLLTNRCSYAVLPVVSPERVDWWKKGTSFLAAKFGRKQYGKSF